MHIVQYGSYGVNVFQKFYSGYVDNLKKLLLSMPKIEMEEVLKKYKDKEPEPLNTMFKERLMQSPLI